MKKITLTYEQFFNLHKEHDEIPFYVKTHKGELTPIIASVKKEAEMYNIKFNNGYELEAADSHAFMGTDGEAKLVKDLKINNRILTTKGYVYPTSIKKSKGNVAYDISIDAPHWYINDEEHGIIHHNTLFALIACKAYLDAHPNAYMIFYDSEGGASESYFKSVGIDLDRVIYIPIMNIEDLKFDMMEKLDAIKQEMDDKGTGNEFVWFIDSIGNLASVKEVADALDKKSVADMSRAKALKSLFRTITPYFKNYQMILVAIQHTYVEIGGMGAPKQIMSGGTGGMYASDDVLIVGKRQIKDGSDVVGWQFILNIEKSRTIRERAAVPFEVTYENGINKYSALLDIACITGHVDKPKMGWYTRPSVENDKNWRKKETDTDEFWAPLLADEGFQQAAHDLYALDGNALLQKKLDVFVQDPVVDEDTGEILNAPTNQAEEGEDENQLDI